MDLRANLTLILLPVKLGPEHAKLDLLFPSPFNVILLKVFGQLPDPEAPLYDDKQLLTLPLYGLSLYVLLDGFLAL